MGTLSEIEKPMEMVKPKSTEQERLPDEFLFAHALLLRSGGGLTAQIAELTGLQEENVLKLRDDLLKSGDLGGKKRQLASIEKAKRSDILSEEYRAERANGMRLAREYWNEGFISAGDLKNWVTLNTLYIAGERDLPWRFTSCLRLEALIEVTVRDLMLTEKDGAKTKDGEVIEEKTHRDRYAQLGHTVDSVWFDSERMKVEEEFILNNLKLLHTVAHTGDKYRPGMYVDTGGCFTLNDEGDKCREPVPSGNNMYGLDPVFIKRRQAVRLKKVGD